MANEMIIGLFALGLLFINFFAIALFAKENQFSKITLWCIVIMFALLRFDFETHLKLHELNNKMDQILEKQMPQDGSIPNVRPMVEKKDRSV